MALSANGRFMAFVAASGNLELFDSVMGTTTLVNHVPGALLTAANGSVGRVAISADGSSIIYGSSASNLVIGQNGTSGIFNEFLYSRTTGTNALVSQASNTAGNGTSGDPAISADGAFVVFPSLASNLVANDINGLLDVFEADTASIPLPPPAVDSIVGRDPASGLWWVGVSNGTSNFITGLADGWNPAVTWTDVQTGDFNGDGHTDLIGRDLQSGRWFVALSDGAGHFTTALWDAWNPSYTWVDVKVGDLNGDGKDDLIGRVLQTGQWFAGISTGSSFATSFWEAWSPNVTWVDVQLGDLNGDGKLDLVGRVLETGQWWVGLSTGSSLQTGLWDAWNSSVTWTDVHTGIFA
jgi:hypothetical protein